MKARRGIHVLALFSLISLGWARTPFAADEPDGLFSQPSVPAVDVEALLALAGDDAPELLEELFLRELLRTAPPAPMLHKEPAEGRPSPTDLAIASYDPATESGTIHAQAMPFEAEGQGAVGVSPPFIPGDPAALDGSDSAEPGEVREEEDVQSVETIVPTAPAPITNTIPYPWRTVVKMLMRFNVSGINYYYVCSGATVGSFMVWTAGHCVFNQDPNDDGSTADKKWADEIWLWPAQTDRVYITGLGVDYAEDWPYGEAKSVLLRSYVGWTASADITWDFGWITLNQRIGDRVGWMGWEWGTETASLNFDGYPAETPYVPAGEMRQYPGYDTGNVDTYYDRRITMDAFTYGGHSGGPVWRYLDPNRYIQGVNSTSNRTGRATAERITSSINTITVDGKADDEANRPPVARPELIEYVHSTTAKDLVTTSVAQGGSISVEYNVYNVGFATTDATIDFYLSTNNYISTSDHAIGTRVLSLAANTYANWTATLTVPPSVPPGSYYVGWKMNSSVAEYKSGDWAVIGPEKLTVNLLPPDLEVPGLTVTQDELCTGQLLGISATVRNLGAVASTATTLRYYQSTDGTISTSDTQRATDAVAAIPPGNVAVEDTSVTAPSPNGYWWIGACVDPVSGEVVTGNQCFTPGRRIFVMPGTMSITSFTYPGGPSSERAGHWISAGSGVVVPAGAIVSYLAEELILDNGFTVHDGGSLSMFNTPPPAGCP